MSRIRLWCGGRGRVGAAELHGRRSHDEADRPHGVRAETTRAVSESQEIGLEDGRSAFGGDPAGYATFSSVRRTGAAVRMLLPDSLDGAIMERFFPAGLPFGALQAGGGLRSLREPDRNRSVRYSCELPNG